MESYNVLLDIIRDLIRNPNPENKKHLESRIEEQFSQSSHNLDKLLDKSSDDIFGIINLFADARDRLAQAQSRGGTVRRDLARCCQLLQLKRDELRSLYIGHVELHKSVKLLTRIRHVGSAPARIQACLAVDDYLGAARELTDSQRVLDRKLAGVKALMAAKSQLAVLSRTIFHSLQANLAHRLYALEAAGPAAADFDGLAAKDFSQVPAPDVGESVNAILCLLEAACCLDKLPQTVQSVLDNLGPSLRDIVVRHTDSALAASQTFKAFVASLLGHLEQVAYRHTVLGKRLNLLVLRTPALGQAASVAAYSEENPALGAISLQLRELLGDYLDVRGENLSYESAVAAGPAQVDLNQLLGRRKMPARPAPVLFRFAYSSHAIGAAQAAAGSGGGGGADQESQQQQRSDGGSPGKQRRPLALVCTAAQSNIVEAHEALRGFAAKVDPADTQGLSAWLENFVQSVFLVSERSRMMPCAMHDPMRLVLPRARAPLLQSCVTLQAFLSDLARYARAMPGQADGAWRIAHDLLQQFGRACQASLAVLTHDQMCTAVSKDLLQLLTDPAALKTEAALRPLTGKLIDQLFYRNEQGARVPREIRELSDAGKVAQLATLSESLSWLVTGATPLFGESPVERKVAEQLDHLKTLSVKCFHVITIEVCLRASNRLKDLPTHSNFSVGVDDIELDDRVTSFLGDLRFLKDALHQRLTAESYTRVFRLLPGVVCALLAILLPSFSRINPLGVKKIGRNLFEMQRVTVDLAGWGEAEFARVRELFDLLLLTPDQIVASVLEQGPRFTQEEYDAVLRVYARTYSSCDEERMRRTREKLRQVISQRHV